MRKQNHLNRWLWKWHLIAGLITLPFMVLLAVTGMIYLFKANYEESVYQPITHVQRSEGGRVSYADQLIAAQGQLKKPISRMIVPNLPPFGLPDQATHFEAGMRSHKQSAYVDPYTGKATGAIIHSDSLMYTVRKLHGELLAGKVGTYTIELVTSWFIVLVLTGLYVWWPAKKFSLAGFFTIRTQKGKRIFYRDLHSVTGFWLSIIMLMFLAGGMPWTDVFGSSLKWVQSNTDTGYPKTWKAKSLTRSQTLGAEPLSLDQMVTVAKGLDLPGEIAIELPASANGVYSVSNRAFYLNDQKVFHFDQYSGQLITSHDWSDVGILMDLRQIFMRLHQGEYGFANWLIVLVSAGLFILSTIAGLVSYLMRKPKGRWGIPEVPEKFIVGKILFTMIIVLGFVFPLFGASLILLWLWDVYQRHPMFTAASK
jgi:uncharacterized iron-regulated membrane protein